MEANSFISGRNSVVLQIALIALATILFSTNIRRPLIDYDEAIYAKVVTDTLHTGQVIDLYRSDRPWFEKPPLHLWTVMGSVSLFGEHEWAFRIPSIILAVLCCWLVYLLTIELTGSVLAAILGFLVLLTSNSFFVFARELRLDMAVIAAILAALYFFLHGWRDEKYLALVLPAMALGFLSKSVVVLLVGPVILAYAALYSQWGFLRSRYFWLGAVAAVVVWAPWHIIETLRYGSAFWNSYVGREVFGRISSTITGTNDPLGYMNMIVPWYMPWNAVVTAGAIALLIVSWKRSIMNRATLAPLLPLGIALGIITLFSLAQTHLGPYIMPTFPFFALAVACLFHAFSKLFPHLTKLLIAAMVLSVIAGGVMSFYTVSKKENEATPFVRDEMMLGKAYRAAGRPDIPLYAFDWPTVDTFNYYGDTQTQIVDPATLSEGTLHGPFFLAMNSRGVRYLFDDKGVLKYPNLQPVFRGDFFILFYSAADLKLSGR